MDKEIHWTQRTDPIDQASPRDSPDEDQIQRSDRERVGTDKSVANHHECERGIDKFAWYCKTFYFKKTQNYKENVGLKKNYLFVYKNFLIFDIVQENAMKYFIVSTITEDKRIRILSMHTLAAVCLCFEENGHDAVSIVSHDCLLEEINWFLTYNHDDRWWMHWPICKNWREKRTDFRSTLK